MLRKRRLLRCRACHYKWLTRWIPKKCPLCHNDWRRKLRYKKHIVRRLN